MLVIVSKISEFLGGRRMEGLLQALASEKKAGQHFRSFLRQSRNEVV